MTLTRQALTRLNAAPVLIKLCNGCFNTASVVASFSRYSVELRVQVTHPSLQWQCGNKNAVELVYWQSDNGSCLSLPAELEPLVEKLRACATMTDEEATALSRENALAFAEVANLMGGY